MNRIKMKWQAEIWKHPADGLWQEAKGGEIWPGDIAFKIVGDINYGTLFTYMFRRFGPTEYGSDDYKNIAEWFLTTPNKNVALIVSPNPSGCKHCFGYMVNSGEFSHRWSEAQRQAVTLALTATIKDLLYPTNVRDVFINAAGCLDDFPGRCYHYFKWAGYGVSLSYFEKTYG